MTPKRSPIRILLVEDDEDDYLLTTDLLGDIEDLDCETVWAPCFASAMELLRRENFDICLVDFRIGGRNGVEFLREARDCGVRSPIVFLTGMGDRKMDLAAMEAGASDFLQKIDLNAATLDRTIRYAINQARDRQSLEEQTGLLQATLDNTGAGIGAIDRDGRLVASNERFIDALGKISGASADIDGLHNSGLDEAYPQLARSVERLECADGTIFGIRRNATVDGGAVIVCEDVTARIQAEQALRAAKQHAEAANRAKSAFLASISHELRTPLNAIIGFADLMVNQAHGPVGSAEYRDYVEFISESGHSLLDIVNKTIDLARIEAHDYPLDRTEVHLFESVTAAWRMHENEAARRGVTFKLTFDDPGLCVLGDDVAIRKMLSEVLANAIKFSDENGCVSLQAEIRDDRVIMRIADTGIGMDPAEMEGVLSAFSQADQKLARRYEGTGLGLPLASALAELHDGRLALESAKLMGTTVTIDLPVHIASALSDTAEDNKLSA